MDHPFGITIVIEPTFPLFTQLNKHIFDSRIKSLVKTGSSLAGGVAPRQTVWLAIRGELWAI